MKNITGPPVVGENFFGREKEVDFAWQKISQGNNLIFSAPRRVGKTSVALRLLGIAKNENWSTISINLEKVSNEHDFINTFIEELKKLSWWQKIKDKGSNFMHFLGQLKPSVSYGDVSVEFDWKSHKEDAFKQLADLLDHTEETLIFFDELTVLLASIIKEGEQGEKNVTDFLHWLRDIRIRSPSKIRWMYCGSVGIENFTYRYGISDTLNDMTPFKLHAYTKEVSMQMLVTLGNSHNLPLQDQIVTAVIDKLDYCLPFFLQIIFEKIHYLVFVESIPLEKAIVDTAYSALISEKHFNTWIERIEEQYGDDKKYAFIMLNHICEVKKGVTRKNLVNLLIGSGLDAGRAREVNSRLLYMLQNDGYLTEEKGYRFRSPLLRDFWFNRFVK